MDEQPIAIPGGAAAIRKRGVRRAMPPRDGRDRATTERKLMAAALRLLERDGVLAGLSLQAVADEAGVNRGLIHHYFGSRRTLLRTAMDRAISDQDREYAEARSREPDLKGLENFLFYAHDPRFARMVLLLALDGDAELQPIPRFKERLADFERERGEGFWREEVDGEAFLALWDTLLYGYAVLRQQLAVQLDADPDVLDHRMLTLFHRMASPLKNCGLPE